MGCHLKKKPLERILHTSSLYHFRHTDVNETSKQMRYSLQDLGLLDAEPESEFDNITKLATEIMGTDVSLVSIIDYGGDRQFFKSAVGLPEPLATQRQTPLSHSFCQHVVKNNAPLVIPYAPDDEQVKDNLAISDYGVIAYLGVPFHNADGVPIGALCVLEGKRREWTKDEISMVGKLALCVSDTIRLKASLLTSEDLRAEQKQFSYAISHDIKAPAISLNMLLDEIDQERACMSDDGRNLLDKSQQLSRRMMNQLDRIIEYTVTTNSTMDVESVNLNDLLTDIQSDLAADIQSTEGELEVSSLPVLSGDYLQFKSLFHNLISNALKFRACDRKPRVSVSTSKSSDPRYHEIEIADNGIGIALENQKKIFELFGRLHTRSDIPGDGIGLSMCQRIVSNHEGSLRISSVEGAGSSFTIKLPCHAE